MSVIAPKRTLTEEDQWINSEKFLNDPDYQKERVQFFQNAKKEDGVIEIYFRGKKKHSILDAIEILSSSIKCEDPEPKPLGYDDLFIVRFS